MKIILIGDSITKGLGSKKINFEDQLLLKIKNSKIINLAETGTTIKRANELINNIIFLKPDVIINFYGNVDAQLRPNRTGKIYKFLPVYFKRFNGSMLSPRPFYSSKLFKKIIQKIENLVRTFLRVIIYKIDGKEQWVKYDEFIELYEKFTKFILEKNIKLINVSTVFLDKKYYPGSVEEYIKYNEAIKKISRIYNVEYLNLFDILKDNVKKKGWDSCYNKDHFHPNGDGYILIANEISKRIICDECI